MKYNPESFICNSCGDCCKNFNVDNGVIIFHKDINKISEYLNISKKKFINKYCHDKQLIENIEIYKLNYKKQQCIFLTDNLCTIHNVKPEQCIRGPFGFFYDGILKYQCMIEADFPKNFNTDKNDIELLKINLKEGD